MVAVTPHGTSSTGLTGTSTSGTHSTPTTGHGTTTGTGVTGSAKTGHHGGLVGKVNDLLHGGAHHTKTANKLDPQLASGPVPLEHATVEHNSSHHGHEVPFGKHGTKSGITAGPHSSDLANKADPRVDSDLDGNRGLGSGTRATSQTTAGPHSSNVANKADPRVDSDVDGKRGLGHGTTSGVTTGPHSSGLGHGTTSGTTTGPHSSNVANKADPRVASDLDGRHGHVSNINATGGAGGFATGVSSGQGGSADYPDEPTSKSSTIGRKSSPVGTTSGTTGPHKSSLLNKLDPRMDSDKDGSRLK